MALSRPLRAHEGLPENMLKNSYEVEVIINGKPAKEYAHKDKVWVEGRKGTRFSIRLRNNSYSRKLFIPTVDGLSVMNGEEGSFKSSGYIVSGHSAMTIDGWRTSDKDVAEFFFSSPEGSYRKKMGRGSNLGVIGVAVVGEIYHPTWASLGTGTTTTINTFPLQGGSAQWNGLYPFYTATGYLPGTTITCGSASQASSSSYATDSIQGKGLSQLSADNSATSAMCCSANLGSAHTQALGTGWGEQKRSEVTTVEFDRQAVPEAVFEINYNTREELEKIGVFFSKPPVYVAPSAFPGQYCTAPGVHSIIKTENCYACTKCGKASGDGDGFVGERCEA